MAEVKNHPTESLLTDVLKLIDSLPNFPKKKDITSQLGDLLDYIRELRPPRIMIIGRCKSGKSSLINAIFGKKVAKISEIEPQTGKAEWKFYKTSQTTGSPVLHILDTRGFQEAKTPNEDPDSRSTPMDSILKAVNEHCPDLILFLCEATSVNVAVQEDINILEEGYQHIYQKYHRKLPLIGVVTKCDHLEPFNGWTQLNEAQKEKRTEQSVQQWRNHLNKKDIWRYHFLDVIPIVSYARYGEEDYADIEPNGDYRWNIDKLVDILLKRLPQEAKVCFARDLKIKEFQEKCAIAVIDTCALMCASLAVVPIPFAATPIVAGIHTMMVTSIGYLSGQERPEETIKDFFLTAGVGAGTDFSLRTIAQELSKLIPGYGNMANAAAVVLATRAIGHTAIQFFIYQRSSEEVKTEMRAIKIE
ncbi:hypothetical protein PCC7805_02247 [Planktothrix agardhii]|uniref:G domain-containing protein n=1 Tax=Planktothrix agardhii TaxID=1160 RepID=A0A1J1JEY1_PLAAG|nr:GTPase [Planktothrix agardhii]MCF3573884.1 50S ribosome-binding GTPase [Planktothrix agardhii 1812]MCF3582199.1 50S ribosome-binding GTPase [Planktothrix agardhii 1811]MCP9294970.1 50S ribosome-binding GTPase [Planktothrix agardhii LY1]CAD5945928.1 hypothetical protein PCC7805_02247 [Planktothrix agardhii]CAD5951598.1 hypothetical protein NO365_02593 [Planktothrix agardhii]